MNLLYFTKHSSFSPLRRKKINCMPWFFIVILSNLFQYKKKKGSRRLKNETIDTTVELTIKTFSDLGSKIKGEGE